MFVNFKKRDKKGRRLSIFAEIVFNQLFILVFTCSPEDNFSRKTGYWLYERWKSGGDPDVAKPISKGVIIVDEKPLKTFINWCNDTYYEADEVFVMNAKAPIVYKLDENGDMIDVKVVGKIKLDKYATSEEE